MGEINLYKSTKEERSEWLQSKMSRRGIRVWIKSHIPPRVVLVWWALLDRPICNKVKFEGISVEIGSPALIKDCDFILL
jgi:hypothetical protein